MKKSTKLLVIVAVIIYMASPADLAPGPLDDFIAMLLGAAAIKGAETRNSM